MNRTAAGRIIQTPVDYEESRTDVSEALSEGAAPLTDLIEKTFDSVEAYGRENPLSLGLWMMGIGFVLGWKMKIW